MSRLKVDVLGPAGRRWLLLPDDAPIADLLPTLVELVGGVDPDLPALAPPVGRPLDVAASLRECGVRPGSTLCLVGAQLAEDAAGVLPPHALVGMRTPPQRTAALLPGSLSAWMRLRTALHLAAVVPLEALPPRVTSGPHPLAFTEVRPPSLWRRARQSWDQLDRLRRLESLVTRARLRRGVTVAVVSPVSGVGATVVTCLLGTLLAHLRRDRVIALDATSTPGALRSLAAPADRVLAAGVAGEPDGQRLTLTGLDASLGQGHHGLRVLAGAPDRDLMQRLARFAGVLLVDCGAGPEAQAAIAFADQALVVSDASREARAALAPTVDRVRRAGRSALLVANAPRQHAGPHDAGRIAVCAPAAEGLVEVPWSPAAVARFAEGRFEWEHASGGWVRAGHELAAALVTDWARLRLTI